MSSSPRPATPSVGESEVPPSTAADSGVENPAPLVASNVCSTPIPSTPTAAPTPFTSPTDSITSPSSRSQLKFIDVTAEADAAAQNASSEANEFDRLGVRRHQLVALLDRFFLSIGHDAAERVLFTDEQDMTHWLWPLSDSTSISFGSEWTSRSGGWFARERVSIVVTDLGIYFFPPLLMLPSANADEPPTPFLLATEYRFVSLHDICWATLPHLRLTAAAQASVTDLIGLRTAEMHFRLRSGVDLWLNADLTHTDELMPAPVEAEQRRQLLAEVIAQAYESLTGLPMELHSAEDGADRTSLLAGMRRSWRTRCGIASGSAEMLSSRQGAAYTLASAEHFGPSATFAGPPIIPELSPEASRGRRSESVEGRAAVAATAALANDQETHSDFLDLDEMQAEQERRAFVELPLLGSGWMKVRHWTARQVHMREQQLQDRQTQHVSAERSRAASDVVAEVEARVRTTSLVTPVANADTDHDISDVLANVGAIAAPQEEPFSFSKLYRNSALERWFESVFDDKDGEQSEEWSEQSPHSNPSRAPPARRIFVVLSRDHLRLFASAAEQEALKFVLSTPPAQRARLPPVHAQSVNLFKSRVSAGALFDPAMSNTFHVRTTDGDVFEFALEQAAPVVSESQIPVESVKPVDWWLMSIEHRLDRTREALQQRRAEETAARQAAWARRRSEPYTP